jgi:methylmalonyl-CoA mutase N-terminal domain/subunit
VIVGVNRHVTGERPAIELHRIDPAGEAGQRAAVANARRSRDHERLQAALAAVQQAARGPDNLLPPIVDAVEARATLGEIADALRRVFGEHREHAA